MRLFDFSLRINGFEISKAKDALNQVQQIPESDYDNYISSKKTEILNYHIAHTPYYKSIVGTIDLMNWQAIPVLTKAHLQLPISKRLSNEFSQKSVYINKTSGSSGHPFTFAKDKWCHALTWAVIADRFSWFNINFNSSKQARFYGIPLDKIAYFKERFKDVLSHRTRFSIFDLSDDVFDDVIKRFKKKKFEYINGYTSAIVQFAKYLHRNNINLKEICPSMKVCVVTSEMLFDNDRALMENQFGIPVINEYGASELDIIAFENIEGQWIVNSETLFVEILDEFNKPVANGEEGRIIITSLYNKAHPFIRYDIGDIGTLSEASTLKQPILKKLTGRTNDIVILPSGKKAAGLTFYYITKSIIEDDGNVKEFIIEQLAIDQFVIKYVSDVPLLPNQQDHIISEVKHYLESNIKVTFDRCEKLKRSSSGKLKQFTSHLAS